MTDYQVKRSYRGEVLVMPEGADPLEGEWITSKDGKRYFRTSQPEAMKYGRASSAGENLKGGGDGLAGWKGAMSAIGTVMSESVRSDIAHLINKYDGDPYYKGRDGGWKSGKSQLMEAVNKACDIAGAATASSRGTEFHHLAEMINQGKTPTIIQQHLVEPLNHYREMVAGIEFLAQEILIINDDLQRAGSVDYLMRIPAGTRTPLGVLDKSMVCVGDLKTGEWAAKYPAGVFAQLAAYGMGCRYDQETNTRSPLHEDFCDNWGVLVHFPLAAPNPTVKFYWVDLDDGMRAAKLSNQVGDAIKYFAGDGKPVEFTL